MLNKYHKLNRNIVNKMRILRTNYLGPIAIIATKLHIKANHITMLSLIMGLAAVYYLFENHMLFIIFGILHLAFDSLDGVVARLGKTSKFGANLDTMVDNGLVVILLIKYGTTLGLAAGMVYAAHSLIYLLSSREMPVLYARTVLLIGFMLSLYWGARLFVIIVGLMGIILQITTKRP